MVPGPCDAAIPAWWHDPATGVCVPFTYGGCEGNANRFVSLDACQAACSGGEPNLDACAGPGECVLVAPICCSSCDPASDRSFVAINRAAATEYSRIHRCETVDCAACPPVAEPERTQQYFVATCDRGQCRTVDIRENDVTACATNADCVLRDGAECCEGCDGHGIVSVNRNGNLGQLVCPVPTVGCPACAPIIPPEYQPLCSNGRCGITFPL
jgi:hypothetical protein